MGVRVCCSDLSRMQAVTSGAPVHSLSSKLRKIKIGGGVN